MSEQKQRSKDIIRTANIAESAHPRLKICGLSRPCDIEWVNDAGVDFAGFVFARSRRQVSPEQAKQLHSMLKKEITAVGVFVNETIETIVSLVEDGVIEDVYKRQDIGVAGNDADRVGNTFAFGSGGIGCIRKSEHFAAQVHHSGFKA